jgi:sporulation protein YlmC with PRC-barrel domain
MSEDTDTEINLVYRVIDDQLVDVDGRRCGRADDLEFTGDLGDPPRLSAILSGQGTWHRRLPRPLRRVGQRIFGSGTFGADIIRVPWSQVEDIGAAVKLRAKARELGLGQGDDRQARVVGKLPDS